LNTRYYIPTPITTQAYELTAADATVLLDRMSPRSVSRNSSGHWTADPGSYGFAGLDAMDGDWVIVTGGTDESWVLFETINAEEYQAVAGPHVVYQTEEA
jgi:hypothetical protein